MGRKHQSPSQKFGKTKKAWRSVNKSSRQRTARKERPEAKRRTECRFWQKAKASYPHGQRVLPFFGRTNQFPFSNHAFTPFEWEGQIVPTSEYVYLPLKAEHFGFQKFAEELRKVEDPKRQKRMMRDEPKLVQLSKDPREFLNILWDRKRAQVMHKILVAKFRGNADARQALLASGDKYLVEASPHDRYWGSGIPPTDVAVQDGPENPCFGFNRLGNLLMRLRESYRTR